MPASAYQVRHVATDVSHVFNATLAKLPMTKHGIMSKNHKACQECSNSIMGVHLESTSLTCGSATYSSWPRGKAVLTTRTQPSDTMLRKTDSVDCRACKATSRPCDVRSLINTFTLALPESVVANQNKSTSKILESCYFTCPDEPSPQHRRSPLSRMAHLPNEASLRLLSDESPSKTPTEHHQSTSYIACFLPCLTQSSLPSHRRTTSQ